MPARRGRRTKKAATRPARRTPSARPKRAKKSARKRAPAKKLAGKKTAARRAVATKKRAVKKKAAAKRKTVAKRAPAKRTAAKRAPAPKRAAPKRAPAPKRLPAPKRAAKSEWPAAGTPFKRRALASLHAGRDAVFAACRELTRETWEAPIAPGKWNPRQIVAHLAAWDAWLMGHIPGASLGHWPPRPTADEENAANARAVEAAAHLDADATLEQFLEGRAQLLSAFEAIAPLPKERWTREHPLGRIASGYAPHDHHHAAQIRAAAARRAVAPQRAAASEKELLLFELQRARVALVAAVKGLSAVAAGRPVAEGKWSPHELVLHCAVRDRVRLEEFDAVLGGAPVSWAALDDEAMARENERHLAELRHLSWDEALRLLQQMRDQLVQRLLAVAPGAVWSAEHPFGGMLRMLPPHDRKHADQIKHARIEG